VDGAGHLVELSLEVPPLRSPRRDMMQEDGSVERTSVCVLPGDSYFCALEKAVSSTSPIGCHVRPSN
jgi:hypothetical protein